MSNKNKELLLTAKDLRIGNYINYECTTHVVAEIHREKIIHYWINSGHDGYVTNYKQILSIPLTEKEVIRLGFNEDFDLIKGVDGYYDDNGYCVILDLDNEVWFCQNNNGTIFKIATIDFVHELQNIYFYITKKELKYNGL